MFDASNSEDPSLITHSCELNYLFDPSSVNDTDLATQMQTWWTNFAKFHDPNGDVEDGLWPEATSFSENELP
jgi:carboxylesterase type B